MTKIKVGVVQATPVLFDLEKTIEKVGRLIEEGAKQNCDLLLLPESFIPAYPRGFSFGAVVGKRSDEGRELWKLYWENSIEAPGKYTEIIGSFVKNAGLYLSIGITEKDSISKSLYCTQLFFSPDGKLVGKHRKIKPTGTERLIWAEGDATTLTTYKSQLGIIGNLICWENYMPEARMAMYKKGVEIYLTPTADSRDSWQHTLKHIAQEGRCFVLGCNQFVKKNDYPEHLQKELSKETEIMCSGGSVIISPMGEVIAGPLFNEEGMLTAEIDLGDLIKSKLDFDVIGHYARNDIFKFEIPNQPDSIEC